MRAEQDIFKDFEDLLNYKIIIDDNYQIITLSKDIITIRIFENARSYEKYFNDVDNGSHISALITPTEHKLLNELFTIWRWL